MGLTVMRHDEIDSRLGNTSVMIVWPQKLTGHPGGPLAEAFGHTIHRLNWIWHIFQHGNEKMSKSVWNRSIFNHEALKWILSISHVKDR